MTPLTARDCIAARLRVQTHPAFSCSQLTAETLKQGVKLFKVNNKDTSSGVFIVNVEHTSYLVLMCILLTLNV